MISLTYEIKLMCISIIWSCRTLLKAVELLFHTYVSSREQILGSNKHNHYYVRENIGNVSYRSVRLRFAQVIYQLCIF